MLRDHLKVVERKTGAKMDRLHRKCPAPLAHVWEWFKQLHPRRQRTEAGAMGLTHIEIDAWSRLTRRAVTAREVDLLLALDAVYLDVRSKDA